jgi:hypothetical protein
MTELMDLENEGNRLSCQKKITVNPTIAWYLLFYGRPFLAEGCL